MSRPGLSPGAGALGDFRRAWPHLFLLSLVTRVAVAVLLLPALALVLRLALASRGRAALSDQEILFFFLSPIGIATLCGLGGAWIGVSLIEQAGLMTIGFGAADGRRVTWLGSLRHVARRFFRVLRLGVQIVVRLLALAAPALALVGAVYWLFLREYDINYYLTNRPPEFLLSVGIAGLLVLGLGVLLAARVLGWMYALPIALFEDRGGRSALRDSVKDTHGHRWKLFAWLVAWLVAGGLASLALTWLLGAAGRLVVPQASDSVRLIAFTIGAVGLLSLTANLLLSFVSAALFALLIVRLYRSDAGPGGLPSDVTADGGAVAAAGFRISSRSVAWGSVAALAVACLAAVMLVRHLPGEDRALVIAHRGAALHAPENTMASVGRALDDGADFIEIDVQESAEGEVVVFHDSDFMKTAGDPLKLWNATRADLEKLDIGSWFDPGFSGERVPTLEEVLIAARGRAGVTIELKYYGHDEALERKVVEIVERTGMADQVVIMSLKYDGIRKIRSLRPDWVYGLLTTVSLGDATAFEVDFLAVNAAAASRRFVRRAHAAGRDLYVWTVNDPFLMSAMLSRGVDGIITDDPGLARRVLEIRSELNPAERLLVGIGTEVGVFSLPVPQADRSDA